MRRGLIIGIVLAVGLVLVPFPETVVPEWKIQVIRSDGNPAAYVRVYQMWKDSSVESGAIMHQEFQETDANGKVTFPERRILSNILLRGMGTVLSYVDFWSHGSYGRFSRISVPGDYKGLYYKEGGELQSTLVLEASY